MFYSIVCVVLQVYARGNSSPLTEYFVWPRKDAWEELKVSLERRPWISDIEKIRLLNRCGAAGDEGELRT